MTQPNKNGTQKERIIRYLLDNLNRRIKCYEFPDKLRIMRYGARIEELRKE
jgi:hypothetical protein